MLHKDIHSSLHHEGRTNTSKSMQWKISSVTILRMCDLLLCHFEMLLYPWGYGDTPLHTPIWNVWFVNFVHTCVDPSCAQNLFTEGRGRY